MSNRDDLHTLLLSLVGEGESVYFQPLTGVSMTYPCIVYQRDDADTKFADNKPYSFVFRYEVTVIDKNPDSGLIPKIAALPKCRFVKHFKYDNLNHDVFRLFF